MNAHVLSNLFKQLGLRRNGWVYAHAEHILAVLPQLIVIESRALELLGLVFLRVVQQGILHTPKWKAQFRFEFRRCQTRLALLELYLLQRLVGCLVVEVLHIVVHQVAQLHCEVVLLLSIQLIGEVVEVKIHQTTLFSVGLPLPL